MKPCLVSIFGMAFSIVTALPIGAQPYSVDATGLPILNSLPSARGVAYIDFNGGTVFGQPRGAYDLDGDPSTFNAAEQEDIYTAWLDVSTHFAMFDLNVTTVAPNKSVTPTAHLLVTPDMSGGAANVGYFGNQSPVARGANNSSNARSRTTGITHEFGHIMGLSHQSEYDSEGNRTKTYRGADPVTNIAPIMGVDFAGKFSSWQEGFKGENMQPQDDFAVISSNIISTYNNFPGGPYNGDGFRPDEHGNTHQTATVLTGSPGADDEIFYGSTGIIERLTDIDMFEFSHGGGQVSVTVEGVRNLAASPDFASSLGMDINLFNSVGDLIATDQAVNAADVNAKLTLGLAPGDYFVGIASHGEYDDRGAYELGIEAVAAGGIPPGDLNEDTMVDLLDWTIFITNNQGDLGTTDPDVSYLLGDMDRDLDSDIFDFLLFREAYENFNGLGSFATMLAATEVPEPSSVLLLAIAVVGWRRWKRS